MKVKDKQFKVYLDEEKIQSRLKEIGKQITEDYQGQELVVVEC